ncbi:MAG: hypothetical protein ACI9MR_001117, partial [Myxococcota bacterium]
VAIGRGGGSAFQQTLHPFGDPFHDGNDVVVARWPSAVEPYLTRRGLVKDPVGS